MRIRVPAGTPAPHADLADYALKRVVDVLNEDVDPLHATNVLRAATAIREEICGPIVKKIELKTSLAELLAAASHDDVIEGEFEEIGALPAHDDAQLDALDPERRHKEAPARPEGPAGADPELAT